MIVQKVEQKRHLCNIWVLYSLEIFMGKKMLLILEIMGKNLVKEKLWKSDGHLILGPAFVVNYLNEDYYL